jgi:hypothetical protein
MRCETHSSRSGPVECGVSDAKVHDAKNVPFALSARPRRFPRSALVAFLLSFGYVRQDSTDPRVFDHRRLIDLSKGIERLTGQVAAFWRARGRVPDGYARRAYESLLRTRSASCLRRYREVARS